MLMAREQEKTAKRDRIQFRRTLNKLMVDRNIFEWKDLRAELVAVGYEIGQSRLSQYLNGKRSPRDEQAFFDAIARALELTEQEKSSLVYAYAYPGGAGRSGPTEETMRRAEEAEKRIRREQVDAEETSDRSDGNRA